VYLLQPSLWVSEIVIDRIPVVEEWPRFALSKPESSSEFAHGDRSTILVGPVLSIEFFEFS
jgi:hypothetical protein